MRKDWNNLVQPLQAAMDAATSGVEEDKCQLAIYHKGKLVISLVSGGCTPHSLFPVFSCSKTLVATLTAILVQEGVLSYDMFIKDIWPEYACNGKESTQLWHFLSHRAGMYTCPVAGDSPQMADWDLMCRLLADAAPASPIGGVEIYHGITYAWLVGEVIQRATGRKFNDVLKDKILRPLGIENDIIFGSDDEIDKRFVPVIPNPDAKPDWCDTFINQKAIRHACIPSASGLMCAEAMARHLASLIGEVDGVRLLSPEILEKATTLCRAADDPLEPPDRWDKFGLGYALQGPLSDLGAAFGQGGACGAEAVAYKYEDVALAFTRNKSITTPNVGDYNSKNAISDILEIPHRLW